MTETDGGGSSALTTDGSAKVETPKQSNDVKTVSLSDYKLALDKMHKAEKENREFRESTEASEAQRLAEKEDWKTLAETRTKALDETKAELNSERGSFRKDVAFNAVRVAALKAGLRNEADLDLLDLSEIQVEKDESGRYQVGRVTEYLEGLKQTRSHWFKDKTVPKFNPGGAGGLPPKSETLTPSRYVELERKYQRLGDTKAISELHQRYMNQQK